MRKQIKGAFMQTMADVLNELRCEETLSSAGFMLPRAHKPMVMHDGERRMENSCAELFARYALSLVGNRMARDLWLLRGWPSGTVLWNDDSAEVATSSLAKLNKYFQNCERLKETLHNLNVIASPNVRRRTDICTPFDGRQSW